MNNRLGNGAYTIVEVMIVLAVSSALLISALYLVGGQQAKTEFRQSINDTQSKVDTIINNVSTGYFTRAVNYSCNFNPAENQLRFASGATVGRGTSEACVLLGKVLHFNVDDKGERYNVYNLVGRRVDSNDNVITDLASSMPTAAAKGCANDALIPDTYNTYAGLNSADRSVEHGTFQYGLKMKKMTYKTSVSSPDIDTTIIAFVTDFPDVGGDRNNSRSAQLYAIKTTEPQLNTNAPGTYVPGTGCLNPPAAISHEEAVDYIDNATTVPVKQPDGSNFVKAYSATICFEGGNNLHAVLTLGDNGNELNTNLVYQTAACT